MLLLDLINDGLNNLARSKLEIDILKNLEFQIIRSDSASEIAGREIIRPVFVFKSTDSFKRFYADLTSSNGNYEDIRSRGFVTDLDIEVESGKKVRIELIMSAPKHEHINHEIRHTIDTNKGKRKGYNAILDELFAYYWETIVEGHIGSNNLWADLRACIWGDKDGYYLDYSENTNEKITFEEYGKITGILIEAIKKIYDRYKDHTKVQRIIGQTMTINELLKNAEEYN